MKQWLVLFLVLLSLSVFAIDSDMNILKVSCWDNGKLKLIVDSSGYIIDSNSIETKAVYQGEEAGVDAFYFPLKASTRYITSEDNVTLESNEAVFNWSGMYRLSISYDKDGETIKFPYEIGCPGLLISCKNSKLEITECSNKDDQFEATINVENLDILEGVDQIENINFFIEAKDIYEDINGEKATTGGLAKGFSITNKSSNIYVISGEFKDNSVKSITAEFKYNDCKLVSEKRCDGFDSIIETTTPKVTGEMVTELDRKRQEVADLVKQNVEDYEKNKFGYLKWIIYGVVGVGILGIGMYILAKRKANKKPNFVKF